MELKASKILDKLLEQDKLFSINGDLVLTAEAQICMQSMDWEAVEKENQKKLAASLVSSSDSFNIQPIVSSDFSIDPSVYQVYLNTLQEYQLTSNKIPRQTRLYWVKRVINKLMRVSTRYQEIFNGAVFRLISLLLEKLTAAHRSMQDIGKHILQLQAEMENQQTANQQFGQLQEQLQEQRALIKNMQEHIEARLSAVEEGCLLEVKKTADLLTKIDEMECLQKKTAGNEEWLKLLSERIEGQEKWLQAESGRITGNEKWLETTNKRIDTCDSQIAFALDAGAQSYSQAGEDLITFFILSNMQQIPSSISYLDIGCNHYKNINNTYFFYQRGLHGVLVEANPNMIADLNKYRPRDTVLNYGIGPKTGSIMNFYITSDGGLSSFNREFIDLSISENASVSISKVVPIEIMSINDIISNHFDSCPNILSIDIEGDELSALSTMDFQKFRPLIFIIETVEYRQYAALGIKRQDIITFMKSKGYEEYAFTGINSIFVDAGKMHGTSEGAK